jgi:hypothetical protein
MDHTLTAEVGAFVASGQAATVRRAARIAAVAGNFALTGKAAVQRSGRRCMAGSGSIALAGQSATLRSATRQAGSVGSFALTGQAAALRRGRAMAAWSGVFAFYGKAAHLGHITDAEYKAWLAADAVERVILVEAKVYSGGEEIIRYFANFPYVSGPFDEPANIAYDDIVAAVPSFRAAIDAPLAVGDLEIWNESGERDAWLDDGWDGRDITLYLGSPTWPREEFRPILTGTIAGIYAPSSDRLSLAIRDKKELLNVPVQKSLYTSGPNKDQPIPLCLGRVENIEPVLVDGATLTYQVHDGAVDWITAVRDNGVPVAFIHDEPNGKFQLLAMPMGRITADVNGARKGYVDYYKNPAECVKWLALRAGLSTSDINEQNFTEFDVSHSGAISLYIRDRRNLIEVLDEIMASVGGHWNFSRTGQLRVWQLNAPTGTAVATFDADDVAQGGLTVTRQELPILTLRLGCNPNWTVQDRDSLAGAVNETQRDYYGKPDLRVHRWVNDDPTAHKGALSPALIRSLLVDGSAEVIRRAGLHNNTVRNVYEAQMLAGVFQVDLGDEITLTHPRFGFEPGANAIVIGFEEHPTGNRGTLELWR